MSRKVTINQGRIVPVPFRFAITFVVFMGMSLALQNLSETPAILTCIFISFLLPIVWSSFHILQILPDENTIKEGYLIMGIKKLDTQRYSTLDKIFINSQLASQTMHARGGQSSTFTNQEYQAYLKTAEGKKYELISSKTEEDLLNRLKTIAQKLEVTIEKNY